MRPQKLNFNPRERQVMAILNLTPDSFYADSRSFDLSAVELCVLRAFSAGASVIDIGGYSSRPGAAKVSPEEELRRVLIGVEAVRRLAPDLLISIDSFRCSVIQGVVERFGPVIINDISSGEGDSSMIDFVVSADLPYIAMHMRGTPQTMQSMTDYPEGVVEHVVNYFSCLTARLLALGLRSENIILDPGFGFAKTTEQNFELLRGVHKVCDLGFPVLAGVSRKSMIWRTLGVTPAESLAGTIALGWESLRQGATILRVHDVREANDTIKLFNEFDR